MHRRPDQEPDTSKFEPSAAAIWPPLRPFIASEYRLGRRWTSALYEFFRFGVKQAWACLFGGIAVFLMIATWWFYPASALYGRGLAKLRNGDVAGSNADISAAKTIRAEIGDDFTRYGVQGSN